MLSCGSITWTESVIAPRVPWEKSILHPREEFGPFWIQDFVGSRVGSYESQIGIGDEEIRKALAETVNVIVDAVRVALARTPPELSADIVDRGIMLTGGGSLLKNLDKRLREETGLPIAMAEDPLSSVVLGAGKMLSDFNLLRRISID